MTDIVFRFPELGRDGKIYLTTSIAYCLAAICSLQGKSFCPALPAAFESGLIQFVSLIGVYSILSTIIILAGRWFNPVWVLMLEWIAFSVILPPVCSFLQDGVYLRGSIILFSRFLPVFSPSLLAEKMSALGELRNPALTKQYYTLAAKILVPIIALSSIAETLL